ncbi:MAG: BlaI/MecI/CopY family transcriptional regulator [Candidatus Uhrbacteria bacterium]|nr:BlaI/MecI/CopY family transcriptional regulator [Patescibacteria group bacterium]MBU1907022.1 BlaI/MecI/CopY family transcriptional regulator [Patescibacteria group bacterium]
MLIDSNNARPLGELERTVLRCLDERGPSTVRELLGCVNQTAKKNYAYTTIMTTMDRLAKKGLLEREPDGRSFRYSLNKSEAEFLGEQTRRELEKNFDHYGTVAIASFVDEIDKADPKLVAKLRQELERRNQ